MRHTVIAILTCWLEHRLYRLRNGVYNLWLELDIFLDRGITDQNFISIDTVLENIRVPQLS